MKILMIVSLLIGVCQIAHSENSADLDSYVGSADFSLSGTNHDIKNQTGARIDHDRLQIKSTGQTFDRYILRSPMMNRSDMADFTIYRASNGDLYSYFWDTSYLRSEESMNSEGAMFNANSWVQLKPQGSTYSGSFYPGDIAEVRLSLSLDRGSITLKRSEREQIVIGPIPIPSPFRKTITEVYSLSR